MQATRSPEHLTHLGILRFTGADALNFLQGQLTNDTRRLAENGALLAGYLNPQGRVLALLHLLSHSSGTLAILPRELMQPIAERMRKFVLRAKVKIDDPGDSLLVFGCHGVEALARAGLTVPPEGSTLEAEGIAVARVGRGPRHWLVTAPHAELDAPPGSADDASAAQAGRAHTGRAETDWRLADIQEGLPQVYGATSEAFVAQMLNLDLLGGISFSKGCYTGQEIVARTQHLGRIKRRLFHLRLPHAAGRLGDWQRGDAVALSDGRHGRLTEVIANDTGAEALAVLTLEPQPTQDAAAPDSDGTSVAAGTAAAVTTAEQVPLPYELT